MPRPSNIERDTAIYEKVNDIGWTFQRTANFFNMSVSSVHEAFRRAEKRLEQGEKKTFSVIHS